MRSLDEAWAWYEHNRALLDLLKRLGDRYWADLPWDGRIANDDEFRLIEGDQVAAMARGVLKAFDDLAIFLLFSVFESIVRAAVAEGMQPEIGALQHPALRRVASRMLDEIAEGSFHNNVLELFKRDGKQAANQPVNALVEGVNRVRRYRNWVAHGRRVDDRPDPIRPNTAYDTLQAFLNHLDSPAEGASG